MSPSMLSRRLRDLEKEGVVERRRENGTSTYHLTEAGREFLPLVHALGVWGQRWTRRQLRKDEIDYRLLVWDMERTVRGDAFGDGRTVVQLTFTDLPASHASWWFVNQKTVQLCVQDPGFDVDLYLSISVPDMIYIWRGDIPLHRALDDARLRAHGPRRLVRRLKPWLNLSPLAAVPSARASADQ